MMRELVKRIWARGDSIISDEIICDNARCDDEDVWEWLIEAGKISEDDLAIDCNQVIDVRYFESVTAEEPSEIKEAYLDDILRKYAPTPNNNLAGFLKKHTCMSRHDIECAIKDGCYFYTDDGEGFADFKASCMDEEEEEIKQDWERLEVIAGYRFDWVL